MHLPTAEWTITGLVTERRVLTSQKNTDWSQPMVKLQTMGDTFEISVDDDLYKRIGQGELVRISGRFERRAGKQGGTHINFIGESVTGVEAAKGRAAS